MADRRYIENVISVKNYSTLMKICMLKQIMTLTKIMCRKVFFIFGGRTPYWNIIFLAVTSQRIV